MADFESSYVLTVNTDTNESPSGLKIQSYGFPSPSMVKNPSANAGEASLISGLGRSPGEGNDNPLQCSCLGNPMDRGAWQAIVHRVSKSQTGEQLNNNNNNNNSTSSRHIRVFSQPESKSNGV